MKPQSLVVSRCDRIGDLVLSLPTLGFLRDAGISGRALHCAPYCRDIAEWARFNELCTEVEIAGEESSRIDSSWGGLSLFHSRATHDAFKKWGLSRTLGPRAKLSSLWSYRKTVTQHRSRVEKSEMAYNVDLARAYLQWQGFELPEFRGLPPLKVPPHWSSPRPSPDLVIVVSNRGSAENWPLHEYLRVAEDRIAQGQSVDFLVSGIDAPARKHAIEQSGLLGRGVGLVEDFSRLSELIFYLTGAAEVLSSSTGPLHLAYAAGVPVFGVYPTVKVQSFERWRPDGYWHSAALRFIEINKDLSA